MWKTEKYCHIFINTLNVWASAFSNLFNSELGHSGTFYVQLTVVQD